MTLEGTPNIVTAAATANLDFHDEADSVNALVPVLKAPGHRDDHRAAPRGRHGTSLSEHVNRARPRRAGGRA